MELTPEEKELQSATVSPKPKSAKGKIAKVDGMAGSLAEKSAKAMNAGIATADRDSLTFAQSYMQRFDQNMQSITGKLTDAWGTVGDYAELGEVEDLPPFEDQLNSLLAG